MKRWMATVALLTTVSATYIHMLTAQEPSPTVRASPRLIREHLDGQSVLTATAVHSVGRSIQDLRSVADDLDKAGHRKESMRLKNAVREIVRRSELELAEKKALVAKLNEEIEELKRTIEQ